MIELLSIFSNLDPVVFSAISNILMVGIWLIYLNIALRQFRLSNHPFFVIHRAHDSDPKAPFLFVNMSKHPVHVSCVIIYVKKNDDYIRWNITDYERITTDDEKVQSKLRQGPLGSGGYLILGSFRDILSTQNTVLNNKDNSYSAEQSLSDIQSFEICVAIVHGESQYHVGARRRFYIEKKNGKINIRSYNIHTEHLLSRKKRDIVRKWVESHLDPIHKGESETRTTEQHAEPDDDYSI